MASRLVLASLLASVAMAAGAHADPAVVISPKDGCGMFDGDGNVVSTNEAQIVATQSSDGTATLRCEIKGVANSTGSSVSFDYGNTGSQCVFMTPFGAEVTENWQETVSSGGSDGLGNATLTCVAN